MSLATTHDQGLGGVVPIDKEAILKSLNLNPRDPKTQALIMVCDRYGLDPLLKHMVLIGGNPYITRDGYLALAHQSGRFDGMEVVEQGENAQEWWAKVAVYRKDMGRPFTYTGRYPKADAKHMAKFGPEMSIKVAEVAALRRAFNVTGVGAAEERWDVDTSEMVVAVDAVDDPPAAPNLMTEIVDQLNALPEAIRKAAKAEFVARFGLPTNLRQSQADAAAAFVASFEAGPASPGEEEGDAASVDPTVGFSESEAERASTASVAEAPPPDRPEFVGAGDGAVSNGGTDTGHSGGAVREPAPTPIDVPSFIEPKLESAHPATLFHEGVKAALPYLPAGFTDSDLRHAVVRAASGGATEDWRQMSGEASDAAVELLTQVAEGTRVLRDTSLGLVCDIRGPADGPFVPDRLGELRDLIGRVKGLGEARCLIRARKLAEQHGLGVPGDFGDIDGELLALVTAEVRAEAEA